MPGVALIYPPTCDPTAPYLSVPTLVGYLRAHGVDVLPIDANVEAWDTLLRREPLTALGARVEERLAALEALPALAHADQLLYAALWRARGDAAAAPGAIDDAVATLRGQRGDFYDPTDYGDAVAAVDSALRLVGAAHAPLTVDFTAYRTPFSLLSADEIRADARPERDPFHATFVGIAERLRRAGVRLAGISVAFPGQIQPAYALAHVLRAYAPDVHLVLGGPAVTQILLRLQGPALARALEPFDEAILFEGEQGLLDSWRAVERGQPRRGVTRGAQVEDLGALPGPDFDGLPLDRYFSPELILPYDPTRGCYWGVCTFCHYGLAEVGTARYRERPVEVSMRHLRALAERHGTRVFYLSQDSVSPKTVLRLARAIRAEGLPWRWATDMRPERSLTPAHTQELAEGGCLAMALGVESAAPRVIQLIDKGLPVETVRTAIVNLAEVGVAVEAMCFTDFPTESYREALATVRFLAELEPELALFICGEFDLTHGALVAQRPADFGIRETWQIDGDELGTGLFYDEARPAKSAAEAEKLDGALAELAERWGVRRYPWAGACSTAHTLLYYERHGPEVFKQVARLGAGVVRGARARVRAARFDVGAVSAAATAHEAEVWHELVRVRRAVSRAVYAELAAAAPAAAPSPGRWRALAGHDPTPATSPPRRSTGRLGRRPDHASNATKG
jgi:hypothetical protein